MITNPVIIKTIIIVMLLLIVGSLFSGLIYMFKTKGRQDDRMVKALTVRITLSIVLFLFLMAGFYFGIIPTRRL